MKIYRIGDRVRHILTDQKMTIASKPLWINDPIFQYCYICVVSIEGTGISYKALEEERDLKGGN